MQIVAKTLSGSQIPLETEQTDRLGDGRVKVQDKEGRRNPLQ
jgi:hypothetical protein